jgi:tetratricopeptide (TPR) repeat protein
MAYVLETRGDLDDAMQLYHQSLESDEALGNVRGTSATLHQMAGVLVMRGELDGALQLYQQSLTIKEALGDVQGKAVTLISLAQLLSDRGEHAVAVQHAQESLRLFEHLGVTREIAQVRAILARLVAASSDAPAAPDPTPSQLAQALVAATTSALRGEIDTAALRAELAGLVVDDALAAYIAALIHSLDRDAAAPPQLLAAAETIMAASSPAERASVLNGVANVADLLGDGETELVARERAIAALREAGDDRDTLVRLSVQLYNLAMQHQQRDDFAAAVPLLEEVVALDERTDHPDLASDRATLEAVRRRAAGAPDPALRDVITAWRDGTRDADGLAVLLNDVCQHVVAVMRGANAAAREALAQDLALLRAARPLAIPGANDFLHLLQLWLRDEPGMAVQRERLRASLPSEVSEALRAMQRDIVGIDADEASADEAKQEERDDGE